MGTSLRVPFGEKEGRLYEPTQVPNGKACGCACPACHRPLIARQNHPTTPHFAHAPGEDCAHAVETAVHLAAKQLIAERQELRLPAVTWYNHWAPKPFFQTLYVERTIAVDTVAVEPWAAGFRPNVTVTHGAETYLVEIAVTHFVAEPKLAKIRARNVPALEIDAPALKTAFTFATLADLLFTAQPYPATWLYHPRREELAQEAQAAYQAEVAAKEAAIEAEQERFRRYRALPSAQKLTRNLKKLGITRAHLQNLTTFVPWEKTLGCPREVWQSAVLVFMQRQIQAQDDLVGIPVPCGLDPEEGWDWLQQVMSVIPDTGDKPRVAFWKYLHYLTERGLIKKTPYRTYEILVNYPEWGRIK